MNLYKKCFYRFPVLREQLLLLGVPGGCQNRQSGLSLGGLAVLEDEIQAGMNALGEMLA